MLQIARGFHHVRQVAAGGLQDRGQVFNRLPALRFDGRGLDAAGCRVDRDLAGGEDQTAGDDRLRVRADGGRSLFGVDGFQGVVLLFSSNRRDMQSAADALRIAHTPVFFKRGADGR